MAKERTESYTRRDSFGRTIKVTRNVDSGVITGTEVVDTVGMPGIRPPVTAIAAAQAAVNQPATPTKTAEETPAGTVLSPPSGNASTEEWAAFAKTMGVDVDADAKRADIQAQLLAANITLDEA